VLKLELRSENPIRPGFARLVIHNWAGNTDNVTLSVQRNQDQCFLDSDRAWIGSEVRHILPTLREDGESCSVALGPDIVDPLLASRENAYLLRLSDGGESDQGGLVIAGDVISSLAGGSNVIPNRLQPLAALDEPPVVASIPQPVVATPPTIDPPPPVPPVKKSSLTWLWLLLVALAIIGLIGAWLLLRPSAGVTSPAADAPAATTAPIKPAEPAAPATSAPVAPAPSASGAPATSAALATPAPSVTASAAPCAPDTMKTTGELDFVKGCLQSQPNSAQVLTIISQAKEQKHCDVAQRLYAYKAQSGDTAIALKYAHEYDPLTAVKGGCFAADTETAVYWYETVINQDAHNAEAKTRLSALKK